MLEKLFKLSEVKTTVRTEIIAGLTTFVTMAYIIFVNPSILSLAGMDHDAVMVATILGAGLTTIAMGLFVNYPIALAPGMGLNAFYTFGVVLGMGVSWQAALGAVFISGVIFILLTVTQIRQLIVDALPGSLRKAITVGIGLFITLIGLKTSGLMTISVSLLPDTLAKINAAHGNGIPGATETVLQVGNLTHPGPLLTLIGIAIIGILMAKRVKGAMLIGILLTTLIGIPMGVTKVPAGFSPIGFPHIQHPAFLQLDVMGALNMGFLLVIFTFTFVELFDTVGTLVGTASKAGLIDSTGRFPRMGRAMLVDACGVAGGALLGTSTITAYIESASGVAEGGKTGLTAVVTGILFLASIIFAPLVGLIPGEATAPALIIVGLLMMEAVVQIDFSDFTEALPAFLTIITMPFTYNIANGIAAGLIMYPTLKLVTGRTREVHWMMWILAMIVVARFIFVQGG